MCVVGVVVSCVVVFVVVGGWTYIGVVDGAFLEFVRPCGVGCRIILGVV
jgi:hypothetical protein